MYCWIKLQINSCCLWLRLCSRDTYDLISVVQNRETYLWQIWSCVALRVCICADSPQWPRSARARCEETRSRRRWELWCNMVWSFLCTNIAKPDGHKDCRRAEVFRVEHDRIISVLLFWCEWEYGIQTSSRDGCTRTRAREHPGQRCHTRVLFQSKGPTKTWMWPLTNVREPWSCKWHSY